MKIKIWYSRFNLLCIEVLLKLPRVLHDLLYVLGFMDKRKCEVCYTKSRNQLRLLSISYTLCNVFINFFFVPNEIFAVMSKYSLDSLESIEEDSLEKSDLMNNNNDNDNNLEAIKSVDKFVKDTSLHLNPILTTLHGIKGTKDVK